jgi:chromosome segregation ATPase
MAIPTCPQGVTPQAADYIFAQLSGEGGLMPGVWPSTLDQPAPPASFEPEPPPEAISRNPELKAAYEWLGREKARLETYTRTQLARIQAQRRETMRQTHQDEQTMILRAQELNRREEFLAHQARRVQEQALQLEHREKALLYHLEQQRQGQEELLTAQKTSEDVRQEIDGQRSLLEALRAETSALLAARDAAKGELAALEAAIPAHREAMARERAALAACREQAEQRVHVLDREEAAMQRRLTELDEWEAQLHQEIEEHERHLSGERREMASLLERLRFQVPSALQGFDFEDGSCGNGE